MLLFCKSKLCNQYKNFYDYESKLDGIVTHIGTNTTISAASSLRSLPNDSNQYQIVDDERETHILQERA